MVSRYRRYLPAALIGVVGLVVVAVIAFASGSEAAVLWGGGAVGVVTGIAIAAISGRVRSD